MNHDHDWYRSSKDEALNQQASHLEKGLSAPESGRRLLEHGKNEIADAKRKSIWRLVISQFSDLLIGVLIGAAIIAGILGEPQDTVAISCIVLLNGLLGFFQEYRAEKAMEALKTLATPRARVRRDGSVVDIPSFELVPGDIVLLESGNMVPADLRILESFELRVDQSPLTGESFPVNKMSERLMASQVPIADQKNMAFKGTVVTAGRAVGLVVRTGMTTELGRVARLLKEEVEVRTPLQARLTRFARSLSLVVISLCIVIFLVGLARGENTVVMFMTALSLAVAGIPEALPAVVTIALALGARRMSRKKALIRKLPAVEALGSVTVICSDKTGTLTENKMKAKSFHIQDVFSTEVPVSKIRSQCWEQALTVMALNNDVIVEGDILRGDPTETALVRAALDAGISRNAIESRFPRIDEAPFTSERGMMSTLHQDSEVQLLLAKGAPERIFQCCKHRYASDGSLMESFDPHAEKRVVEEMAKNGFRVLALASRKISQKTQSIPLAELETDLVYLGLVGLMDPPRPEVKRAIELCQSAGIRVVMITGDHPSTARSIASELGIVARGGEEVVSGVQLSGLSDHQLAQRVRDIAVYARVAPEQKIRIVKSLQAQGEIVAMTGDGVNDAPALKRADVGVSMGKGGTDVAREASHVILLDDNFATIVAAVREGRRIYDNLRKFVRFALSGNSGEIWTLFLAPFLGLPIPLLPIHILWVNLVTDGLPGLALAFEPEEKYLMKRPPRQPAESLFSHGLWQHSVWVGILTAASTLGILAWAYHSEHAHWQSMAFTVLTLIQMGHVLAIRSETQSLFDLGLKSNKPLLLTVILTLGLQLCTLYVPTFNRIFKTQPLTAMELLLCGVVSTSVFIAVEIEKWFQRRHLVV